MIQNRDNFDSIDTERALIGSLILKQELIDTLASRLTAADFFDKQFGKLFSLLVEMRERRQAIDILTLRLNMTSRGIDIPMAELGLIFTTVPHALHATHYAEHVLESSRIRKLKKSIKQTAIDLESPMVDSESIVNNLESLIDECRTAEDDEVRTMAEAGVELIAELESTKGMRRSADWGIWSLDQVVGGLMPGEVCVIAARPGNGKTSLAVQVALHNSESHRKAFIVSLEMRRVELAARVFGGLTGVSGDDIRRNRLNNVQLAKLETGVEQLKDAPLFVYDPPVASMSQIRGKIKQLGDVSLLVIDYLSLIRPEQKARHQDRHLEVAEISRRCKRLAKELRIPIIVLQQLNRTAEGQVPTLAKLAESGAIEQDADIVLFLHRDDRGSNGFELIVAKHRHAQPGVKVQLDFDGSATRFSAVSPPQFGGFEAYS